MFNVEYWDNRAEKYGHTGHAEPFHYCFDQAARLFAIDKILKNIELNKDSALDFGCGSGDFIELLSHHFKIIQGFDVSEKAVQQTRERFKHSRILISSHIEDCIRVNGFDLILTVTVLQTLSRTELEKTILLLNSFLSEGGKIISMEFFSTVEYNLRANEKRVTDADWAEILRKNQLQIMQTKGFYNPILYPTKSWKRYKTSPVNLFIRLFKHQVFVKKLLMRRANKMINKYKDVYPYESSTFKVYIIEKIK